MPPDPPHLRKPAWPTGRYFFGSLATALGCVVALVLFRALYGDRRVVAIKAAALAPLARGRGEEHDEQKFTGVLRMFTPKARQDKHRCTPSPAPPCYFYRRVLAQQGGAPGAAAAACASLPQQERCRCA